MGVTCRVVDVYACHVCMSSAQALQNSHNDAQSRSSELADLQSQYASSQSSLAELTTRYDTCERERKTAMTDVQQKMKAIGEWEAKYGKQTSEMESVLKQLKEKMNELGTVKQGLQTEVRSEAGLWIVVMHVALMWMMMRTMA